MKKEIYDNIFNSGIGAELYNTAISAIETFKMQELIDKGVLVGFSGGADSLFLLLFLIEYRRRNDLDFNIVALHVNHGIRGDEADRDERFSKNVAEDLGIEFLSYKSDVPTLAENSSMSIEEAARNVRYNIFDEIIDTRDDISVIATAHNAGDNFETVLFNMMRGSGLRGMCGISPVRKNIIRPLIYISKSDIEYVLNDKNIDFAVDSTNFSTDYTRNYIRHELIPKFARLTEYPERSITRLCENLRIDNTFIEETAEKVFNENFKNGKIKSDVLRSLHPAVFKRVISRMNDVSGSDSLESVHYTEIFRLIKSGTDFSISLPGGRSFICERDFSYVGNKHTSMMHFEHRLCLGVNEIPGFSDKILISQDKPDKSFLNVYKISIQHKIHFDIINKALYVRNKRDGDSYSYGGMSHKLKKLFNDKKVPLSKRALIPVFSDDEGIVWVPGFGVHDVGSNCELYITIFKTDDNENTNDNFYIPIAK